MAAHTYTLTPPVGLDGTNIVQSVGTVPGGGASILLEIDDTLATSKASVVKDLEKLIKFIMEDTWPPSV